MAHQPTDVPDRSLDSDRPSRVWLTAVLRPAGTLADAFADAVAQTIDELSRTADMVVVDLEAAQIPDAEAVANRLRSPAARLASVGKCLLLLNLPEALVHAVQAEDVPAVALPADVDPGLDPSPLPSTSRHHPAVISSTQATSWRRLRTSNTWSQCGA